LEGSPEEKLVLDALRANASGADVDKIITMTKLEPRTANQALGFLLIKGMIKETENGYIIK
jgi:predicted transcriptional regulator